MSGILVYLTQDEASKLNDKGYVEWSDDRHGYITTGAGDNLFRILLKEAGVI